MQILGIRFINKFCILQFQAIRLAIKRTFSVYLCTRTIRPDTLAYNKAIEEGRQNKPARVMYEFTDDTAMARSVAKSLIQHNKLNVTDMARRFTEEYRRESGRGYGASVTTVFQVLHDTNYSDVFAPASNQFEGKGSYGNGGAMRICPVGLFAQKKGLDFQGLVKITEGITRLTHTHPQAIQGAILEAYAVKLALSTDSLDTNHFIDDLIEKMKVVEQSYPVQGEQDEKELSENKGPEETVSCQSYCDKLEKIREFVNRKEQPGIDEITKELGVYIAAFESVPAAVYCFLRATKSIDGLEECNEFARTILYAISHGGDTDTVATMAGAIAGAYYGLDRIPSSWQWCCEGVYDALHDAELLYNLPNDSEESK